MANRTQVSIAPMDIEEDMDKGICILSFDNGGPGTYSQLVIVDEYMKHLTVAPGINAENHRPAEYFDLIGGVGFGGLLAFTLGHLRMTVDEAIEALLIIASAVFPLDPDPEASPESNTLKLKEAIEDMLEARDIPINAKMCDKRLPPPKCKVALYAATSTNVSQPKILRTYPHRGSSLNPTIVEALCATMAHPSLFSPIKIGPPRMERSFVGGPLGANNPTRELLKEAEATFGNEKRVAQIISLGAGKPHSLPLESLTPTEAPDHLLKFPDCEVVASELSSRLFTVDAYVRLNMDSQEDIRGIDDWHGLEEIEKETGAYLKTPPIARLLGISLQYLKSRVGTATLGQINHSSNARSNVKTAPAVSPYHVVRDKAWNTMVHHLVVLSCANQKIFAITGMGGSGKTQLVSYFLQEKGFLYIQIVFVDASSLSTIKTDLQAWVRSLDGSEQGVWEDALIILASGLYDGRWILIFDNADNPALDLNRFFPKCYKGTVIITSRNRDAGYLANSYHLELGEMEKVEALSTLLRAARRQESLSSEELTDAYVLIEKLGYLAVALVQAGTYCHQLSVTSQGGVEPFTFAQYTELFSVQRLELMKKAESSSLDDYQLGTYAAFDLSYKAIPQNARRFLHFTSSFHHSSIPLPMLAAAAKYAFADPRTFLPRSEDHKVVVSDLETLLCIEGKWSELQAHETIRKLRSFSLISASSAMNMVFIHFHPLVHAWARDLSASQFQHSRKLAVQVLTSCSAMTETKEFQYYFPHFQEVFDQSTSDLHVNDQMAAGVVFNERGLDEQAEALFSQALVAVKKDESSNEECAIKVAGWLAISYDDQGKLTEAEQLKREILEQQEKLLGENHLATIQTASNLGATLRFQERLNESEQIKLWVLEKRTRILGEWHPKTLDEAESLSLTYSDQERWKEAEELILHVLERRKIVLGMDHMDTMNSEIILSNVYRNQGKLAEAEKLVSKVKEKCRLLLGNDHPQTIWATTELAQTLATQKRWDEAITAAKEVLGKQKRMFGSGASNTAMAVVNLAGSLADQGRLNEAEVLERELLELLTSRHGVDHRDTLLVAGNLARTLADQERLSEAEALESEVLGYRVKALGWDHSDTLLTARNLASTFAAQGRSSEAEALRRNVLGRLTETLGREHSTTILATGDLAGSLVDQGRLSEAEVLEREVVELQIKKMGRDHSETLLAAGNLARILAEQGRWNEAELLERDVLERRTKLFGREYLDTISAGANLARTLAEQGFLDEAEKLEVTTLEQRKRLLSVDDPLRIRASANLAITYRLQGRLDEAEELGRSAFEHRQRVLGREHVDTIRSAAEVAITLRLLGRLTEAEALGVEVLELHRRTIGLRHPNTIGVEVDLALTFQAQERWDEAESLLSHAVELSVEVLGKQHPYTQTRIRDMIDLLKVVGRVDKIGDLEQMCL